MSDEVILSWMKRPDPKKKAKSSRGRSEIFPRMVRLFIESGDDELEIDYENMDRERKFSAVAQSLRIALDDETGNNGRPLADIARVSVDAKAEPPTIALVRRTPEQTEEWIRTEPERLARAAKAKETRRRAAEAAQSASESGE